MKWLWGIVAGVAVGLALAVVYFRNPLRQIAAEFEAIEAAKVADKRVLEAGALVAQKRIEVEHAKTIRCFDREQRQKLRKLRSDPVALARWLTRVSG